MPGKKAISNAGKIFQITGLYHKGEDCVSNAGTVTLIQGQYTNWAGSTSSQSSTAPFQILCSLLFIGNLIILYCIVCLIRQ